MDYRVWFLGPLRTGLRTDRRHDLITTSQLLWLVCVMVGLPSVISNEVECHFEAPSRLSHTCLSMSEYHQLIGVGLRSGMGYYLSRDTAEGLPKCQPLSSHWTFGDVYSKQAHGAARHVLNLYFKNPVDYYEISVAAIVHLKSIRLIRVRRRSVHISEVRVLPVGHVAESSLVQIRLLRPAREPVPPLVLHTEHDPEPRDQDH